MPDLLITIWLFVFFWLESADFYRFGYVNHADRRICVFGLRMFRLDKIVKIS